MLSISCINKISYLQSKVPPLLFSKNGRIKQKYTYFNNNVIHTTKKRGKKRNYGFETRKSSEYVHASLIKSSKFKGKSIK